MKLWKLLDFYFFLQGTFIKGGGTTVFNKYHFKNPKCIRQDLGILKI